MPKRDPKHFGEFAKADVADGWLLLSPETRTTVKGEFIISPMNIDSKAATAELSLCVDSLSKHNEVVEIHSVSMIPKELSSILSQDPEIMSGAICFTGTRIPVQILLDNHRAWVPMDVFLDAYPDLSEVQVRAVLDWEDSQARKSLGLAVPA